jgi:hydroxyacylglutathione hydrolase
VRVERLTLGRLDTNCWLVSDDSGGPAFVIDPGDEPDAVLRVLDGRQIAAVVLTHGHFDHVGGVARLLAETDAPLFAYPGDDLDIALPLGAEMHEQLFGSSAAAPPAHRDLEAGETLEAGQLRLTVLPTPGHTPGSVCLLAEDPTGGPPHLFSGDTLFAGSVGRTDMPGGDGRTLARSIAEQLAPLSDATVVHPGHGPDTTIGRERRVNPFFPRG